MATPHAHGAPALKLLTFNVWDHNARPDATIAAILRADPDIVTIQEADGLGQSELTLLERAYPYRATCSAGCSLIMLSKRPWAGAAPYFAQADARDLAIWGVTTAADGQPVQVLTTHYLWPIPPAPQAAQRAALAGVVGSLDRRGLIVAGDFNLAPWTAALQRQDAAFAPLTRRTRGLFSWPAMIAPLHRPAPFAILPIDQIYAGPVWRTVSIRPLPRAGSDHYGVLVTLARDPPRSGLVPSPKPAQR
jgi:vancomycin resistance protein VanJ